MTNKIIWGNCGSGGNTKTKSEYFVSLFNFFLVVALMLLTLLLLLWCGPNIWFPAPQSHGLFCILLLILFSFVVSWCFWYFPFFLRFGQNVIDGRTDCLSGWGCTARAQPTFPAAPTKTLHLHCVPAGGQTIIITDSITSSIPNCRSRINQRRCQKGSCKINRKLQGGLPVES